MNQPGEWCRNQPNVIDLAALLCERHSGKEYDGGFCPECMMDADWLSLRGVLVPSSLTATDVDADYCGGVAVVNGQLDRDELVAALERIAKGDV